jgi:hypothetical protein
VKFEKSSGDINPQTVNKRDVPVSCGGQGNYLSFHGFSKINTFNHLLFVDITKRHRHNLKLGKKILATADDNLQKPLINRNVHTKTKDLFFLGSAKKEAMIFRIVWERKSNNYFSDASRNTSIKLIDHIKASIDGVDDIGRDNKVIHHYIREIPMVSQGRKEIIEKYQWCIIFFSGSSQLHKKIRDNIRPSFK